MGGCLEKALDLIARRPHFRREVERKLIERGFDPTQVDATVEELTRRGWIDDLSNAREMARGAFSRKNFGPRRIQHELQRRGVEQEVALHVVAELFSEPDEELTRAREAVARKKRGGSVDRDRLARYLDRRGFSKAVIVRVLQE